MISVEEALLKIKSNLEVLSAEQVSLSNSLARVLAENAASQSTSPPFRVSAMDGYAVRREDLSEIPAKLEKIGESAAGRPYQGALNIGQCVRIFTGAMIPDGADTIIIQENTQSKDGIVSIQKPSEPGQWIRPAGFDFSEGEVLLKSGRVLTARDIGLLASMNMPWVQVRRRPQVAIISTGDELVMPGEPEKVGQIKSSNGLSIEAYVKALGGVPVNLGIAPDTVLGIEKLMKASAGADILVTSGGASVGDYDFVREALGSGGLDRGFHKVAMRPGKPVIFGFLAGLPVLGLPGNPVSACVTATIFLRAAMESLLGISKKQHKKIVLLGKNLPKNSERQDYIRATLDTNAKGEQIAIPFALQDSAIVTTLALADCLIIRPPFAEASVAGDNTEVIELNHSLISI